MSPRDLKPSPLSPSSSAAKKRLLSDHHKPKLSPNLQLGSATIPDGDQLLCPQKKTRDLPNLSDCHGCGLRINHTNPKDRLQTLDSVWRIVLLCRRCVKLVESGQMCPYCFKVSVGSECLKCRDCHRQIHKECVVKCGDSSPWSLCKSELGSGLEGFSICIDCWVPRVFRKSIRIVRRKRWVLKDSQKLQLNECKRAKHLCRTREQAASGVDCFAGREVVLALVAQPNASRKAMVSRNALEVANGVVDLVGKKGKKGGKRSEGLARSNSVADAKCSKSSSSSKAVDDEKLAFQLHRAMNSSPRISRSLCSFNTNCYDVPETRNGSGSCAGEHQFKPMKSYSRSKRKETTTYKRGSTKRKMFLDDMDDGFSAEVVEKIEPRDGVKTGTGVSSSEEDNLSKHEDLNETRSTREVKCDTDAFIEGETEIEKFDRYELKYSKRLAVCKF